MNPPALSTMWLQNRYARLVDFFAAGQEMGFTGFELSHSLPLEMFAGFRPGDWQIAAVHDPCPRPAGAHPLNLASLDEEVRARSVQATRQTIDTAVRSGAPVVCLHAGHVEMSPSSTTWVSGSTRVTPRPWPTWAWNPWRPGLTPTAGYGRRMVGVHFHDIVGSRDHLVAGIGELDFAAIGRHIPAEAVRTCEFDWYFTPEEVKAGVRYLQETGCLP